MGSEQDKEDKLRKQGTSHPEDPRRLAQELLELGRACRRAGEHSRATESLAQALALYEQLDEPGHAAVALNNLGAVAWSLGQLETARGRFEAAREQAARAGNLTASAFALGNLGLVLNDLGQPLAAEV